MFTKYFPSTGTFTAHAAACGWLRSIGCSVGSMERDNPIGIKRGEWGENRSKWRHYSAEERAAFDGRIMPDPEFREGGARVELNFIPASEGSAPSPAP